MKTIISETLQTYAATPYNRENVHEVPHELLQFISDQLLLEVLLISIRVMTIRFGSRKNENKGQKSYIYKNK